MEASAPDGRVLWERRFEPVGSARLRTFWAAAPRARGGALLLAGEERAATIALAAVGADGAGEIASEIDLPSPPRAPRRMSSTRAGAVLAFGVAPETGTDADALVLRLEAPARVARATRIRALHGVHAVAPGEDGSVVAVGVGGGDAADPALLVVHLGPEGEVRFARRIGARGLRVDAAFASVAVTASGALLVAFELEGERGADVGIVRLDAEGGLRWARRVERTREDRARTAAGVRPAAVRLHAVGVSGERGFLALTDPVVAPGRFSRLVLVELGEAGEVRRQRTVPTTTEREMRFEASEAGLRIDLEDMPPCSFPSSGAASCGGAETSASLPIADAPVSAIPWLVEARAEPLVARAVALRTR